MKRAIALMICVLLVLGVPVPSDARESGAVYAVPVNNYTVKRTGLTGGSVFPLKGYSLCGETADRQLAWNVNAENLSLANTAALVFCSMNQPLVGSEGMVFYISTPAENTVAFTLELKKPDDTARWKFSYSPELSPAVGAEYMILRDGGTAWESGSFISTASGLAYKGGIQLDRAFSGFVKIPYSSLKNDSGFKFNPKLDVLEQMPFRFSRVGGDYGAVTVAPIFLISEDGTAPEVALPDEYKVCEPVRAYAFNNYKINSGNLLHNKVYLTDSGSVTAEELYTNTATAPRVSQLCYTGMNEPLDGTDGIMLYLKLPAENRITLSFTLNDPGERWKHSYPAQMLLLAGTEYRVLPDGAAEWETRTVQSSDNGTEYRGWLVFGSAFSGYVIIPYQSFKNDSGFTLLPEKDTMFDLNISLSQMSQSYGTVTAWGGLKSAGDTTGNKVSVYGRGNVLCAESDGGKTDISRSVAACGERVTVTVSPNDGNRLAATGLKAVYNDITGEKRSLIVEKGDTEIIGAGSGRIFYFLMPEAEQVTVTAEYTEYGNAEPDLFEPVAMGADSIKFGMRLYSSNLSISHTGFLLSNKESAVSHGGITDGIIDIPCSEPADETAAEDERFKYYDYSLTVDGIIDHETRYTVRGYAAYYSDGKLNYIYTNTLTVSLGELSEKTFSEMESFGEITEAKSYYCNVKTAESAVTQLSNTKALNISVAGGQRCDNDKTQDSTYWASASYAPFSLDGITDVMIYVKAPAGYDNNMYITLTDSLGNSYKLWGGRAYEVLNRGESVWKDKMTGEGKNRTFGLIELPAGFDGFVKIPLTSLYVASKLNGSSQLCKITYRFSYIGDETAPVTAGPVFGLYGEGRKPEKSVVTADLPQATAEARVYTEKSQMLANGGIFYWEKTDNAESYLITAYKREGGYKKVSSYRVYSNSGAVTGLTADTEYYVQISACDSKEKVIAYYAPFAVTTALSDPQAAPQQTADGFIAPVVSSNSADIGYETLSAGNSVLLDANPNRGLRGCMEFYHFSPGDDELYSKLNRYIKSSGFTSTDCSVYVCYIYPGDYRGGRLDDAFFETVQKIFDYCRQKQIQLLLRFAYYDVNNFNDRTPTTAEILSHMDQIAENGILTRNADILHTLQVGFVGQFGEWHSENEPTDRSAVLSRFVEKLLPDGVYSQLRMQNYKQYLPENTDRRRFGIHLDSYFGIMDSSDLGGGSFSYGNSEWDEFLTEAAYAPNDAELYYWDQFNSGGVYCEGYAAAIGAKQLCLTTFSGVNGYFDSGIYSESCMSQWKKLPVTPEWLSFNSLPYSDGWFKDADGSRVSRNVFEYIRDFLGYRLSAERFTASFGDETVNVSLTLKNYGFSAAFNLESELVILDGENNAVSRAFVGNPSEWYGTNTVTCALGMPAAPGNYKIALCIKSKSGAFARLDNSIPFENGYNILCRYTKE